MIRSQNNKFRIFLQKNVQCVFYVHFAFIEKSWIYFRDKDVSLKSLEWFRNMWPLGIIFNGIWKCFLAHKIIYVTPIHGVQKNIYLAFQTFQNTFNCSTQQIVINVATSTLFLHIVNIFTVTFTFTLNQYLTTVKYSKI